MSKSLTLTMSLLAVGIVSSVAGANSACVETYSFSQVIQPRNELPGQAFTRDILEQAKASNSVVRFVSNGEYFYGHVAGISEQSAQIKTAAGVNVVRYNSVSERFEFAESVADHNQRLSRLANSLPEGRINMLQAAQLAARTQGRILVRLKVTQPQGLTEIRTFVGRAQTIEATRDRSRFDVESLYVFTKLDKITIDTYSASGEHLKHEESERNNGRVGELDFGRSAEFDLASPNLESIEVEQGVTRSLNRSLIHQFLGVFGI